MDIPDTCRTYGEFTGDRTGLAKGYA